MKKISLPALLLLTAIFFFNSACKKFLDEKSDSRLAIPGKLSDLMAILDNIDINNYALTLANTGTDEYYLTVDDWNTLDDLNKKGHIWDPATEDVDDWKTAYQTIFYANTVLDQLINVEAGAHQDQWNKIRSHALFFRAYAFYSLAQLYAPQYDPATASTDLGIPLRIGSDFNKATTRPSVQATYDRIILDLDSALLLAPADLLPTTKENKTRPGKPAMYALLARTYLQMGNYTLARDNSEKSLQLYSPLVNFEQLPTLMDFNPFQDFSVPEVIFYTNTFSAVNLYDWMAKVDTNLYKSYQEGDLRKVAYFEEMVPGSQAFEGSYNGAYRLFNGLATDEMYLVSAEANARLGNVQPALDRLNTLLMNRWASASFVPVSETNPELLLKIILEERRKELLNRGTRWADLRRLNKDPQFAVTLQRTMEGQSYELMPNDLRYTILIPQQVIQLSNIPQNPR